MCSMLLYIHAARVQNVSAEFFFYGSVSEMLLYYNLPVVNGAAGQLFGDWAQLIVIGL